MGKKRKEKRRHRHRYRAPARPPPTPTQRKKKGTPGWIKAFVPILFIGVIGAVAVWQFSPSESPLQPPLQPPSEPPSQQGYPTYATGVFYDNPTITGNGTKIQLPYTFVKDKKIVFVDLELSSSRSELEYEGRTIPLDLYKDGNYLPVIALFTPTGKVKVGLRTCEPCAGFSMHIDKGKYLVCDVCNTEWDLETFKGVSGGCPEYPPPQLPVTIDNNIEIDLSALGVKIAA